MGSTTGVWGMQFGSFGLLRHLFRFVPRPHGDSEEIRHLVSQQFHIPETVLPVHVPTRYCYLHPSPALNLLCTGSSKIEKTDSNADSYHLSFDMFQPSLIQHFVLDGQQALFCFWHRGQSSWDQF